MVEAVRARGWSGAVCYDSLVSRSGLSQLCCRLGSGEVLRGGPPEQVRDVLRHLRTVMADDQHGAWLSVEVVVGPQGHASFHYNYDRRPAWMWAAYHRETLLDDLVEHPRRLDRTPEWYRRLLDPALDATASWDEVEFSPHFPEVDREKVAYATLDPELLSVLAVDSYEPVRFGVAGGAQTPAGTLATLAQDESKRVRYGVATNPTTPPEVLAALADTEVAMSVVGNPSTPLAVWFTLSRNADPEVRREVARHSGSTPVAVLESMLDDPDSRVRTALAGNRDLPAAARDRLAGDNDGPPART